MCSARTFPADFRKQQHLQCQSEASDNTRSHCWGEPRPVKDTVLTGGGVPGWRRKETNQRTRWPLSASIFIQSRKWEELWLHIVLSETNRAPLFSASLLSVLQGVERGWQAYTWTDNKTTGHSSYFTSVWLARYIGFYFGVKANAAIFTPLRSQSLKTCPNNLFLVFCHSGGFLSEVWGRVRI